MCFYPQRGENTKRSFHWSIYQVKLIFLGACSLFADRGSVWSAAILSMCQNVLERLHSCTQATHYTHTHTQILLVHHLFKRAELLGGTISFNLYGLRGAQGMLGTSCVHDWSSSLGCWGKLDWRTRTQLGQSSTRSLADLTCYTQGAERNLTWSDRYSLRFTSKVEEEKEKGWGKGGGGGGGVFQDSWFRLIFREYYPCNGAARMWKCHRKRWL